MLYLGCPFTWSLSLFYHWQRGTDLVLVPMKLEHFSCSQKRIFCQAVGRRGIGHHHRWEAARTYAKPKRCNTVKAQRRLGYFRREIKGFKKNMLVIVSWDKFGSSWGLIPDWDDSFTSFSRFMLVSWVKFGSCWGLIRFMSVSWDKFWSSWGLKQDLDDSFTFWAISC